MQKEVFFSHDFKKIMVFLTRFPPFVRSCFVVDKRLFGKAYQKNDYVFKWPDGRTFAPDYVTHHFSKMLERYGMPHIRFHELRHSCASLLLNNGCGLKDVQEWMGHSDIQTTANIYGHLDTSRKQSLADKLTECLREGR